MVINTFNIQDGNYAFIERGILTTEHQHPTLEIMLAREGAITVTHKEYTRQMKGCLICANTAHAINSVGATCELWMFENERNTLPILLNLLEQPSGDNSIVPISEEQLTLFTKQLFGELSKANRKTSGIDQRVVHCIEYINKGIPNTPLNRKDLAGLVHLSESRLSHLFKTTTGVSIKNYIVWARLKHTMLATIEQKMTLLEAAYYAGFYDAAHFSRAFQKMFGLNPSSVYNSSILQK